MCVVYPRDDGMMGCASGYRLMTSGLVPGVVLPGAASRAMLSENSWWCRLVL